MTVDRNKGRIAIEHFQRAGAGLDPHRRIGVGASADWAAFGIGGNQHLAAINQDKVLRWLIADVAAVIASQMCVFG